MRCDGPREFRRAKQAEAEAGAPPAAPAAPPAAAAPVRRKGPNVPRKVRWRRELEWQEKRQPAAVANAAKRARANTPQATHAAAVKRAAKEAAVLRARAIAGLPRPQPRTPEGQTGGERLGLPLYKRR